MPVDILGLLLHPVRLRIVHVMSGGRTHTTADLCTSLADVPKTTVYRHVGLLAAEGLLEVAHEQRVHGAVERHYRLRRDRAAIDADTVAAMSPDGHRRAFAAAMAVLLAEFNGYLARPGADPAGDSVGYRQGTVWLSAEERVALSDSLQALLVPLAAQEPTPDRSPHLLSAILFPASQTP